MPVEDASWANSDPTQRRRRTLDACRALLLREAQVQPTIVVFEDLHWTDSESLAFIDSLVESLPKASLLLLVNFRPEFRGAWSAKSYYTRIRIDPLQPQGAAELLQDRIGDDASLRDFKATADRAYRRQSVLPGRECPYPDRKWRAGRQARRLLLRRPTPEETKNKGVSAGRPIPITTTAEKSRSPRRGPPYPAGSFLGTNTATTAPKFFLKIERRHRQG